MQWDALCSCYLVIQPEESYTKRLFIMSVRMESTLERQGGGLEDDCRTVVDEAKEAHSPTTDTRNTGLRDLPGSWVMQCNKTPSSLETNICFL